MGIRKVKGKGGYSSVLDCACILSWGERASVVCMSDCEGYAWEPLMYGSEESHPSLH